MKKPLSDLDRVKASDELKAKTLQTVIQKKKRSAASWIAPLVTITACVVCFILFQTYQKASPEPSPQPDPSIQQVVAYVTFDVNPSIEFHLDGKNTVVEVVAYNEDGTALLQNIDWKQRTIKECIDLMSKDASFQSYMETGYLQVSVYSDDTKRSLTLEQEITQTLSKHYEEDQYGCTCASKRDHEEASDHHMSFGRYQLIQMIIGIDSSYTVEGLENSSMRELKDLYENLSGQPPQMHGQGHGNGHGRNHE